MYWKVKAFIQNCISIFPENISYTMYYGVQRYFGALRKPFKPIYHIKNGIKLLEKILQTGLSINGKIFFEVGTGWVPIMPLVYWLGGAEEVITVDLNPYMKKSLFKESLDYIFRNQNEIRNLFGDLLKLDRFAILINNYNKVDFVLKVANIKYFAPCDAGSVKLPDNYIDYHVSFGVYQHIPPNSLVEILKEGIRITKKEGLLINQLNYSDMFTVSSKTDKNITAINFLKYNDYEWDKYAGNKFMYTNRLRHDDFIGLFNDLGFTFVNVEPVCDNTIFETLENKSINLDKRFCDKPNDILSTTYAWFILRINSYDKTDQSI
jgi:SAM-dependent methyltransferase